MTPQEKQLKKKIQLIVASALSLFFVLITVLAFQFAIRINQRNLERDLIAQSQLLSQQIQSANRDIDYYNSNKFAEDFALKYLGWGREGQVIFGAD